jgi:multidrug efflux pump subunit AcrA (membrane-fusion protein)/DNA-binding NarL/FixJ family response regulator
MLRILLVDDQNLVRQGLKILLESNKNLKIVGVADNGRDAIKQVAIFRPDIVLIDVEMPGMNGLIATKKICEQFPGTKILVLSSHENEQYASQAIESGAYGYLLKSMLVKDLEQAIQLVDRGYPQIEPKLLTKVIVGSSDYEFITKKKQKLIPAQQNEQNKSTPEILHGKNQNSSSDKLQPNTVVGGKNNTVQINSTGNREQSVIAQNSSLNNSQHLDLVHSQQNHLPSISANDFMPPIDLFTRLGGFFLVGSLGVLIILSAFTPYRVTVKAASAIRPTGKIKVIQAETEGKITSIKAEENETIKKGEIIATIDPSYLQTEKSQLQNKIQQAYLQLKQINNQIDALNIQIQAEIIKNQEGKAEAKVELSSSRRSYRDRQVTTAAEVDEAEANSKLAQKELQEAKVGLKSEEATLISQLAAFKAAQSKSNRYESIENTGALSKDLLDEAQLTAEQEKQAIVAQKAKIEQQKRLIERQYHAVEATQARLKNVQAALNPSDAEVEVALKRIAQVEASGDATIATIDRDIKAMIQQRIDIQKQLERDKQELKQMGISLNQTIIKSPAQGTLFQSSLNNSGQIVQSGTEIAKIAPADSSLMAKALVVAKDIDLIDVGQTAQLKISACPYPDYGTLKGLVKEISPDALQQTSDANSLAGDKTGTFYEVKIGLKDTTLSQGSKKCSLQLGMEGTADIISREESVLHFLLRKARLITDV